MGKNVDTKELRAFAKKLESVIEDNSEKRLFFETCAKEIAARLLTRVIKRTPSISGNLRRGWTAGAENVSEKGNITGVLGKSGAASKLNVVYRNGEYRMAIYNPTKYAIYVEYGHRTRGKKGKPGTGWVNGRFMLRFSVDEVNRITPALLEKRLNVWLREVFK